MGTYRPLFKVTVEHGYFETGSCPVLSYMPTPESAAVMKNAGLMQRSLNDGIAVFYDDANEALPLYAGDPQSPLRLAFKAYASDPCFNIYTAPGAPDDGHVLFFDSVKTRHDGDGRQCLHTQAVVSEQDYAAFAEPQLAPLLDARDRLIRPAFVLQITIDPPVAANDDQRLNFSLISYYLRFQARQTVWKYYLLGGMAKEAAYITDLNSEAEFVCDGEAVLADNRRALAFRSRVALPLRQQSPYRFQLKTQAAGGGKVLIKRLAVASSSQVSREEIEGHVVDVSEIYINC